MKKTHRLYLSLAIAAAAVGITYIPLPGLGQRTVTIVSGSELQEPLEYLEEQFEAQNPAIAIELEFQGSQDLVNNYIDDRNDFIPTILIPANGQLLDELDRRWRTQNNNSDPFYDPPQAIAKTMLVAVAWPERGEALFPGDRFRWERLEAALQAPNWAAIGGDSRWGSFDFVMTDPTRSNSGQLTLSLWAQASSNASTLDTASLNSPPIQDLFGLVKRSVYLPPRSTDTLLQEFIARGPNDADMATVYESIALYRWEQADRTSGKPYRIYYLNPTVETVSTAAIVRREVDDRAAKAARQFLQYLAAPEQQAVFVRYGFRPADGNVDLAAVPGSPWPNVPGAQVDPPSQAAPPPERSAIAEIVRLWQRAN